MLSVVFEGLKGRRGRRMHRLSSCPCLLFVMSIALSTTWLTMAAGQEFADLQIISNPENQSTAVVSKAWQNYTSAKSSTVPQALEAMNHASPMGGNWLSSAIDRILEVHSPSTAELDNIEAFLLDEANGSQARLTAMDILKRFAKDRIDSLNEKLVRDPVARFRKPMIAKQIEIAKQLVEAKDPKAVSSLMETLDVARDERQVQEIAKMLADLDSPIQLAKHFGFVANWNVVGPFPNADGAGHELPYPIEEKRVETLLAMLASEQMEKDPDYPAASWQKVTADEKSGNVDLAKEFSDVAEGVAYGLAVVESEGERDVQLRLRIQNAFKIWLNGELLLAQPVGHTGNAFDQYIVEARLAPGKNLLLVKSCQVTPLQDMDFFKVWHFGVRLTDSTGAGLNEEIEP